jgi:5-methyltetrahydrofolate--homocysteine methyltransferase
MSHILQRLETQLLIGPGPERLRAERAQYDAPTGHGVPWELNHPDVYQDILREQFNMGCDFVVAPVGNRLRQRKSGLRETTREVDEQLAKLTREVVPSSCYLFCSLTNLSMILPPMGDATLDEAYESYVEQIAIAEDVGVDLYQLHTGSMEQMELGIKAVKEHSKAPVAVILSLHPTPKGPRTLTGLDPGTAVKRSEELGAELLGQTCGGLSYEGVTAALRELRATCDRPLYTRPNAGVPELVNGEAVHPRTPEEMAKGALDWVDAGARIIAGCCGTTPEHTAEVIAALK